MGKHTPVEVGQVWRDNDDRALSNPRLVQVVAVGETHATVANLATGRTTRIALKRFRPTKTGYVLESTP